mmetsp:Transcript_6689/g.19389  ORF Transcript_6689/g.19389 Transcript_6689/m.19389 type:complete len:286 (+) Transcript_6689:186-1043(+)
MGSKFDEGGSYAAALRDGRAVGAPKDGVDRHPEDVVGRRHHREGERVHRRPRHHVRSQGGREVLRADGLPQGVVRRRGAALEKVRPGEEADEDGRVRDVVERDLEPHRVHRIPQHNRPLQPVVPKVVERPCADAAPASHHRGAAQVAAAAAGGGGGAGGGGLGARRGRDGLRQEVSDGCKHRRGNCSRQQRPLGVCSRVRVGGAVDRGGHGRAGAKPEHVGRARRRRRQLQRIPVLVRRLGDHVTVRRPRRLRASRLAAKRRAKWAATARGWLPRDAAADEARDV